MKKILLLTLVMLAIIFALASCADDRPTTTQPTVPPEPPVHEHIEEIIPAVESTCTQTGLTEGKKCSECGEILVEQEEMPLADHTEEIIPAIESTCTEAGLTEGMKCSVCGEILVAQQNAPLKAHTYDNDEDAICNICDYERYCVHHNTVTLEAIASTCTSTGLTEGKKCADCEEILVEQEVIGMLDHDYATVTVTAPTCENQGYTTHTCKCGAFYIDTYVDALGHDYDMWYMYRDETTPIEGEGRRDCTRENCEHYDTHVASSGFKYSVNSDGTTCALTGIGSCGDTELFLPFNIDGYEVTGIGGYAFAACNIFSSVIMPYTITDIDQYAFERCSSLTTIVFSDSLTSIGYAAFKICKSITKIEIPDEVTEIGQWAFSNCSSLTSIVIPDSVTSIGRATFAGCTSLTGIEVDTNNKHYKSIEGNLYSKDGKDLIQYAVGKEVTSFTLPDSVTVIGWYAFYKCKSLTSIEIPDSVKFIGWHAFEECTYLTSIDMPDSLTSIGADAFKDCRSFTNIEIPESVTSIDGGAFGGCYSLVEVINKSSISIVAGSSDHGCVGYYAKQIINDEGQSKLKTVGDFIFYDDGNEIYLVKYIGKINELTLPKYNGEKEYEILGFAFNNNTTVRRVIIPDGVTSIGNSAFSGCSSLTSIVIPDSVTSIADLTFHTCPLLTNATISKNSKLTSIGNSAFYDCSSLTTIVIPDGVTSIGGSAFSGCSSLTIYCEATSKQNGWHSTWNFDNRPVVWIPQPKPSSEGLEYTLNSDGKGYSVTGIGTCTDTDIVIPETYNSLPVTGIGNHAFNSCTLLTSIVIPNSVTSIGSSSFYNCISLTNIFIPNSVTNIGDCAFMNCRALTNMHIPQSVTSIGYLAFEFCYSLRSIIISDSVTNIDTKAFKDCPGLIIYCEAESQPSGWASDWNPSNRPVVWGYKPE